VTGLEYDEGLIEEIATRLDMRAPNIAALDRIARALETAVSGTEIVATLATGVGKTYIAGGLLDYLQQQNVRNVVIITPGNTIQRKTLANLDPRHRKFLRGLQCRPVVITVDDVKTGTVGQALNDPTAFKVFVLTVQSLLRPNTKDNRRAHKPYEDVGEGLSTYLAHCDDLVVIADEYHTYFGNNADQFQAAVQDLHPTAVVGLTATPHLSTQQHVVYEYDLAEAIADKYVKIPVLVARSDGHKDLRTQLADGGALLDAKDTAMRTYCDTTQQQYVRPVMFVVADKIDEAADISEMLAGPDLLGNPDQVLLVTSDQSKEALDRLDDLENPHSKVRAVVSVSMLKEGWDVKNIYVIAAVRPLRSQLLTEQVLGRGLRLPFGRRTGNGMLDTVEVLSHDSFRDLLSSAEALFLRSLGASAEDVDATEATEPGVAGRPLVGDALAGAADDGAQEVLFTLPAGEVTDEGGRTVNLDWAQDGYLGMDDLVAAPRQIAIAGTVDARLAAAAAITATMRDAVVPTQHPGVPLPLFIPRVTVRLERDSLSLAQIDVTDAEALGRRFSADNAPTLTRKAIEAFRDDEGVHLDIKDRSDEASVRASQTIPMPFDTIQSDLVRRLLESNAVSQTLTEKNAAVRVAAAFLLGAKVTEETPWRREHGRLATRALTEWIGAKQTATPRREVVEITQVKWPDPPEMHNGKPPGDRHKITRSSEFTVGYPYKGWTRGLYDTCSFDAYSTEFRLAELLDNSGPGIRAWVRLTRNVPLTIAYLSGAGTRTYYPDFIVIDEPGTYWIVEGKRDDEMRDDVVLAKRDAAAAWVKTVNNSGNVQETWGYVLASEAVIKDAANWASLKAAAQTFR